MDHEQPCSQNREPDLFVPLEALIRVTQEQGRWVVYLNVPAWQPQEDQHPVTNHWRRINDYSTQQQADVAARWYLRSANRNCQPPTGF